MTSTADRKSLDYIDYKQLASMCLKDLLAKLKDGSLTTILEVSIMDMVTLIRLL
jgi:hypothetical protein